MKKAIFIASLLAIFIFLGVGCITIGPKQGVQGGGIYLSQDKGKNWAGKNTAPTAQGMGTISNINVMDLIADPQDDRAIYLASAGSGLFYTWNKAETWNYVEGLGNGFVNSLAIDYKDKCTLYAALQNKIWKSADCARTWKSQYYDTREGEYVSYIAIDPSNSNILYAGLSRGDLLKSVDRGISWSTVKRFKNKVQKIVIYPTNTNIVFVGLEHNGLWKSNNKGATWKDLRENMKAYKESAEIYDVDITDDGKSIYATSKYGVLLSKDVGEKWNEIKLLTAPASVKIYCFAVNPNNAREIYYSTASTFYSSQDGGANWTTKKLPTSRAGTALLVDSKNNNLIYLGTRLFKK